MPAPSTRARSRVPPPKRPDSAARVGSSFLGIATGVLGALTIAVAVLGALFIAMWGAAPVVVAVTLPAAAASVVGHWAFVASRGRLSREMRISAVAAWAATLSAVLAYVLFLIVANWR